MRIGRPSTARPGLLDHLIRVHPLADLHQGRVLDPALDTGLELIRVGRIHRTLYRTRVDGVDRGPFSEFPRPDARHGLQGRLGAAVDGLAQETTLGRDGGQIDHPARAVGGEIRSGGLDEE